MSLDAMSRDVTQTPLSPNPQPEAHPPGLWRRMACFAYEGVLLFGVVMIAAYLYSSLTQQRHALQGQWGLRFFLFMTLAIYFTWFWSRGGQTVAMKAWHLRLVDTQGRPVGQGRAFARYLLSWLWFMPALATAHFAGLNSTAQIFGLMAVGVVAYAFLARLHPQRQFWHDVVCGTRLVTWRPALPPRKGKGKAVVPPSGPSEGASGPSGGSA